MSNMSQINPGSSINFDAQAIHDAEEADYAREEHEQQNELRQALMSAFDDDLSDEESDLSHDQGHSPTSPRQQVLPSTGAANEPSEEPQLTSTAEWQGHVQHEDTRYQGQDGHDVETAAPPLHPHPAPGDLPRSAASAAIGSAPGYPPQQIGDWTERYSSTPVGNAGEQAPDTGAAEGGHGNVQDLYGYQDHYGAHVHDGYDNDMMTQQQQQQQQQHRLAPYLYPERGEIEGANADDGQYLDSMGQGYMPPPSMNPEHYHYQDTGPTETFDQHSHDYYGEQYAAFPDHANDGDFVQVAHGNNNGNAGYHLADDVIPVAPGHDADGGRPHAQVTDIAGYHGDVRLTHQVRPPSGSPSGEDPRSRPTGNNDGPDAYRVQYRNTPGPPSRQDQGVPKTTVPEEVLVPRPTTPGRDFEDMQKDFLHAGGNRGQMEQLQILYNARGRKLEELNQQLKVLREEGDREIRILKHKVTLTEDERDGLAVSFEENRTLLDQSRRKEAELEGQIQGLESQVKALASAKEELIKKIQTQESAIESLNSQLVSLEASESLVRARDQHEAIVSALRHKYETQVFGLQEQVDAASRTREERDAEVLALKRRVGELVRAAEHAQIDRGDTVNRLTRSLEESQRQCQEMLEAGHGQELSKTKMQLQEALASKSITEDMNSAVQREMKELKEQLTLYEGASQLGVFSMTSSKLTGAPLDDSYVNLAIKRSVGLAKTPERGHGDSETPTLSEQDTISGLKQELERCIVMYRAKRQETSQLQEELRVARSRMQEAESQLKSSEAQAKQSAEALKRLEDQFGDAVRSENPREAKMQKELELLRAGRETLHMDLEEVKRRLEETAGNEETVSELNQELRSQMNQMIKEFDEDKRLALERCQETLLRHQEATWEHMRQQLVADAEAEKTALRQELEANLTESEAHLRAAQDELMEVKDLYVSVCREKDQLEETMQQEYQTKLEQQLSELEARLTKDNVADKEEQTADERTDGERLHAKEAKVQDEAKEKWIEEQENEFKRKLSNEMARSKIEWFQEHQTLRAQAVERAVKVKDMEWQQKWEAKFAKELDQEVEKANEVWVSAQQETLAALVAESVDAARKTWKESDLEEALQRARLEWEATVTRNEGDKTVEESVAQVNEQPSPLEGAKTEAAETANINLTDKWKELKQELDQLQSEKRSMRAEVELLQTDTATWRQHLLDSVEKKVAERKSALKDMDAQNEADYRKFLEEHKETLNKALKSAREQHASEIESLAKRHGEEMTAMKKKLLAESREALINSSKQEAGSISETECQERLQHLREKHEEEKKDMAQTHRQNMASALQDARTRWQKKLEGALEQTERTVLLERERQWEAERAQYLAELMERDHLLQLADSHMETEITKLHANLQQQHQQELQQELLEMQANAGKKEIQQLQLELDRLHEKLRDEHEEDLGVKLRQLREDLEASHVEDTQRKVEAAQRELLQRHEEEVQEKLRELREELEKDHEAEKNILKEDQQKATNKLEDTRKQLKELYTRYNKDTKHLAQTIETLEQRLRDAMEEMDRATLSLQENEAENTQLRAKVQDLEAQLDKAEQQRQAAVDALQRGEKEHSDMVASYKARQTELNEKLQRQDNFLKAIEAKAQEQLAAMQASLEREHAAAMETLKSKMVEMSRGHSSRLEALRKQHAIEKQELGRVIDRLSGEKPDTPTQTDRDDNPITMLKEHYLAAVERIRADVLEHVADSNRQAAESVRAEIVKERQNTARRLRKYYLRCLAKVLDKEGDSSNKSRKLAAMERYLDNLPERDGSRSTTPSVPSLSSGDSRSRTTTPDVSTPAPAPEASPSVRSRQTGDSTGNLPRDAGQAAFRTYRRLPRESQASPRSVANDRQRASQYQGGVDVTEQWVTSQRGGQAYHMTSDQKTVLSPRSQMTYPISSIRKESAVDRRVVSGAGVVIRTHRDRDQIRDEELQELRERRHSRGHSLESAQPTDSLRRPTVQDLSASNPEISPNRDRDDVFRTGTGARGDRDGSVTPTPDKPDFRSDSRSSVGFPVETSSVQSTPDTERSIRNRPRAGKSDLITQVLANLYGTASPVDEILDKYTWPSDFASMDNIREPSREGSMEIPGGRADYQEVDLGGRGIVCYSADPFAGRPASSAGDIPSHGSYRYTSLRTALSTDRLSMVGTQEPPRSAGSQVHSRDPFLQDTGGLHGTTWDGSVRIPDSIFGHVTRRQRSPRPYNPPPERLEDPEGRGGVVPPSDLRDRQGGVRLKTPKATPSVGNRSPSQRHNGASPRAQAAQIQNERVLSRGSFPMDLSRTTARASYPTVESVSSWVPPQEETASGGAVGISLRLHRPIPIMAQNLPQGGATSSSSQVRSIKTNN